jgi:hypothetical protein
LKTNYKLHILSLFALGVFCFLAAGSMEDSSSNKKESSPQQQATAAKPDTPSVGIALKCVDTESETPPSYFFYGDAAKEFFRFDASGHLQWRASLSPFSTTDAEYVYSCNYLDDAMNFADPCSSFTLKRDTLGLTEFQRLPPSMSGVAGPSYSYSCKLLDKDGASQAFNKRSEAIRRQDAEEQKKKAEQLKRNQL